MRYKTKLPLLVLAFMIKTVCSEEQRFCVPTMGRIGSAGDMYNAITNQKTGRSIFDSEVPPHLIKHYSKVTTNYRFSWLNNMKDKFESLNANLDVSVSFMLGLIKVSGNVGYMGTSRVNSSEVRAGLTFSRKTGESVLQVSNKNFSSYLSADVFKIADATHFIHTIEGGGEATAEVSAFTSSTVSKIQAGGSIKAYMKKLQIVADVSVAGNFSDESSESHENVNVKIYADCSLPKISTSSSEAIKLMQDIPALLENATSTYGKSMQTQWCLYPLPWLEKLHSNVFAIKENITAFDNTFKQAIIQRLFEILASNHDLTDELKLLHHDAELNRNHITKTDMDSLTDLKNKWSSSYLEFMDNSTESFNDALKSKDKQKEIIRAMNDFESSDYSHTKVKAKLDDDFNRVRHTLRLLPYLHSQGIIPVGKKIYFEELLTQSTTDRIFVFFDDRKTRRYDKDFTPTFESFELAKNGTKFYLDCQISATNCSDLGAKENGISLKHYALGVDMQNIPKINDTVWADILEANYALQKTLIQRVPALDHIEEKIGEWEKYQIEMKELYNQFTAAIEKSRMATPKPRGCRFC